jgi:CrcB protein
MMSNVLPYLLVGIGGFVGSNARFVVTRWAAPLLAVPYPLGTFLVNISGSFLLGVLGGLVATRVTPASDAMRLALGVGFLGAYTTFSTFELETHALLEGGAWLAAVLNITGSVFVGLLAIRAGIVLARAWMV